MIYPDTSFLFSLYVQEGPTPLAEAYAEKLAEPLTFTPFHRLELRTAFRLRAFRKEVTLDELRLALQRSDEALVGGILRHTPLYGQTL